MTVDATKPGIASGVGDAEYGRIAMAFLNRATAPLYFVDPIRAFEKRASRIFSTHPRTIDRVNRLRALRGAAPMEGDLRIREGVD
jgi:Zn-dependent protease with chaperone function